MSMFSIGVSGLHTAQLALNTTSNNISNIFTPGYNRELTLMSEQRAGGGVQVTDVQRQFDHFISSQLNSATSSSSALQAQETQISQIDNLLGDLDAGLAPIMQNFFSSLQDLAATPADPAARQGVIGTASSLTAQFRSFDNYLQDMQDGIAGELAGEVTQVNNTVEQIAGLNRDIILAKAKNGEAPNSLLNQRDHLLATLNERIDTRLSIQEGSYNITVGNGQPLVSGTEAYALTTMRSAADPSRTVVGYVDSAGNDLELSESTFSGGAIGGLMSFRNDTLDTVQNKLGQMSLSLALAFNEQHQAGTNLEGNPGADFFSVAEPTSFSHGSNTGGATLNAAFTDHNDIAGIDYDLSVTDVTDPAASEFLVTPRDGGEAFTVTANAGGELSFGGMTVTVDDVNVLAEGDRFRLQPTRHAAANFDNLIHDSAGIAAGASGASGDNENALLLQELQTASVVGGSSSLSQAYASIIGDVGNSTNIVQVNLAAQESLTDQIRTVQQSESGVSLEEEGVNLIRYQQFYQANAKVIETGATLFDTILGLRA